MTIPSPENRLTAGGDGSKGATRKPIAAASAIRIRAGTNRAPNRGATIKQAPMRTKGQNHSVSHPINCAWVMLIIELSESSKEY